MTTTTNQYSLLGPFSSPNEISSTTLSSRLWKQHVSIGFSCLYHPFILQLASGCLSIEHFHIYTFQDSYFLSCFLRCYSSILSHIPKSDTKAISITNNLLQSVEEELKLQKQMDIDKNISILQSTKNYCDFLDYINNTGNICDIICAMTPCMRLYYFIASNLKYSIDDLEITPYKDWIIMYSSDEFLNSTLEHEWLLDHFSLHYTNNQGRLYSLYNNAMVLEELFFSQIIKPNDDILPHIIYSDFDNTITHSDTLQFIFKGVIKSTQKLETENHVTVKNTLIKQATDIYIAKSKENFDLAINNSKTIHEFMDIIDKFEDDMYSLLVPIIEGIEKSSIIDIGNHIKMKFGVLRFFEISLKNSIPVHVCSVNPSKLLINSTINRSTLNSNINIHSSEIKFNDNDIATNQFITKSSTSSNKLKICKAIENNNEHIKKTIYIGDSINDVKPLLNAWLPIIIGNDKKLLSILQKFNISVLPLIRAAINITKNNFPIKNTIYQVNSWLEIEKLLFPCHLSNNVNNSIPKVLIVAGSDSGGGAGIQADIKSCCMNGVFAMTVISSVTSQNTIGVSDIHNIPINSINTQIEACLSDIGSCVIKTGMIPSVDIANSISNAIIKYKIQYSVIDPVMVSSSGCNLISTTDAKHIAKRLFPISTIITPNIPEAMFLLDNFKINNINDIYIAAEMLKIKYQCNWILIKGGHLSINNNNICTDILYNGDNYYEINTPLIKTNNIHGTGCTLASSISSFLAKGYSVLESVLYAKDYIYGCINYSCKLKIGKGNHGPMNHCYKLLKWPMPQNIIFNNENNVFSKNIDYSLYGITDSKLNKKYNRNLINSVKEAVNGGCTMIQLREKSLNTKKFTEYALELVNQFKNTNINIIINDRVDIAMAVKADGVHVGQDDMPASLVRNIIGPNMILGVSVKTVDEGIRAVFDGANYLGVGAIFKTLTKEDDNAIGLHGLAKICKAINIPIVAIGGLDKSNVDTIFELGVSGMACVSSLFDTDDIYTSTKDISNIINQYKIKNNINNNIKSSFGLKTCKYLKIVRNDCPIVQCLTNFVSMDIMANILLASGMSPAMVHAKEELAEFILIASTISINIGTLSKEWIDCFILGAKIANENNKPWVLDPVGVGTTNLRNETCLSLLKYNPTVIRGNASEIISLSSIINENNSNDIIIDDNISSKGIDSSKDSLSAIESAKILATKYNCIVVVTGKIDYITNGNYTLAVNNGNKLLTKVTATGCSLSSLIAGFISIISLKDYNSNSKKYVNIVACSIAYYNICSELAFTKSGNNPSSFRMYFIDYLSSVEMYLLNTMTNISIFKK